MAFAAINLRLSSLDSKRSDVTIVLRSSIKSFDNLLSIFFIVLLTKLCKNNICLIVERRWFQFAGWDDKANRNWNSEIVLAFFFFEAKKMFEQINFGMENIWDFSLHHQIYLRFSPSPKMKELFPLLFVIDKHRAWNIFSSNNNWYNTKCLFSKQQ